MNFLSNAHTHTTFCDGKSTHQEMLEAAKQLGFVSLGFSGHGDQGFDHAYSMGQGRQKEYHKALRLMQAQQKEEGEGPRLWVGLEQDGATPEALKELNKELFDYIIGSTHYLCPDYEGASVAVDGDPVLLTKYVERTFDGDWMEMVKTYYDDHVHMLLHDRPQIIGHFDLVRKNGGPGGLFDVDTPVYSRMALDALEKARASEAVLEVNTGAMARGYADTPYPSKALLGCWGELGGQITLTSDCHDARFLDHGYDRALELIKACGFTEIQRLGQGESLWETITL